MTSLCILRHLSPCRCAQATGPMTQHPAVVGSVLTLPFSEMHVSASGGLANNSCSPSPTFSRLVLERKLVIFLRFLQPRICPCVALFFGYETENLAVKPRRSQEHSSGAPVLCFPPGASVSIPSPKT